MTFGSPGRRVSPGAFEPGGFEPAIRAKGKWLRNVRWPGSPHISKRQRLRYSDANEYWMVAMLSHTFSQARLLSARAAVQAVVEAELAHSAAQVRVYGEDNRYQEP